jgi:hypothetical protein
MWGTSGQPGKSDALPRPLVSTHGEHRGDRLNAQTARRPATLATRTSATSVFTSRFGNAFAARAVDVVEQASNDNDDDVTTGTLAYASPQAPTRSLVQRAAPYRLASADEPTRSIAPTNKQPRLASLGPTPGSSALADVDEHTAIYDIAGHTIYLPDGQKLEAHSGLGDHFDDPRSVSLRNRGVTPPNVYRLTLRERIFHGVRALRLIPIGDGNMHGRDGILAHSYMLGPRGQSNGCMAVRNYPAFLQAFLSGKVERLVVVDRLSKSNPRIASLR